MYMCIFVGPQSPPTVKKRRRRRTEKKPSAYRRRTCSCALMQTRREHRYAWTLADYRHKNRCLHAQTHTHTQAYVHTAHTTYAWTNRLASKHRCEPTDVNTAAHLEERVCEQSASSSAVGSTRHSEALFRALRTCQSGISITGQGQDGGVFVTLLSEGDDFLIHNKVINLCKKSRTKRWITCRDKEEKVSHCATPSDGRTQWWPSDRLFAKLHWLWATPSKQAPFQGLQALNRGIIYRHKHDFFLLSDL